MSDFFDKLFNLHSSNVVREADKKGLIEKQLDSIEGQEIRTKTELQNKSFVKKIKTTFAKINLNLW